MNYHKTLNLPQTNFPMRAQLPQREPEMIRFWEEMDVYSLVREKRKGAPLFVLHDGPPYANGAIHMGTALNKVLKDMVVKFSTMKGMDSPYVPGWDTHGLPIEHQVIKNKKVKRKEISTLEFRKLCHDYALKYVDVQRDQFRRIGIRGDWQNPYLTLSPSFEAKQIEVFGKMASQGYIYKGLKPVYWCADCETALAEAEIEYTDQKSPSIYFKFSLPATEKSKLGNIDGDVYCLVWTTTPWTIPANMAVAVHPEFNYVLINNGSEYYLLAEGLLEEVQKNVEQENWQIINRYKGSELEGIKCLHPLFERESPFILAEHVTLEQGTGCVHTAPAHGLEDFEVGSRYGLTVLNPLDDRGYFTEDAGQFAGLRYNEGNKEVVNELKEKGSLLKFEFIEHQYPHCWRCKKPVLFRATEQWFASVKGFREQALQSIQKVSWHPRWGEERIYNMVQDRQDWCISRQRVWGVPIPIFYCNSCKETLINDNTIEAVQKLFEEEGSDAWFKYEASEILPAGTSCEHCGVSNFSKEMDIMDVWFDSGSSHMAVCDNHEDLQWPADLYLEGSDQYRGWFQSSLLTSVAVRGEPPYRGVVSHGWVVDGEGKKMSKSMGNVISPEEIIKEYGADILRLWVSSADFTRDVNLSDDILKQLGEVYRKIRNTSRFLLGNLFDFEPQVHKMSYEQLDELDRWALARLQLLIEKVTRAYENYEFHQVFHAIHNFCVVDMSNFYLNVNKDKLYCSQPEAFPRRMTQAVMYQILQKLCLMIAPILSFTAEEIWQAMPGEKEESVQLADWPVVDKDMMDKQLLDNWEQILDVRDEVMRALEQARANKEIRDTLEAEITIWAEGSLYERIRPFEDQLETLLVVSNCNLHKKEEDEACNGWQSERLPLTIKVEKTAKDKCERCWSYTKLVENKDICPRCKEVVNNLNG